MSISLDVDVQAKIDSGTWIEVKLIRFDIPGNPVGYWLGGRDLTWNGFLYKPSRYLDDSGMSETLGSDITERSVTFSNVPTSDSSDVIAIIEQTAYLNSDVIVTKLLGDTETDEILGLLESTTYEIDHVSYNTPAIAEDGTRQVTVIIELEIPGRTIRDHTGIKYSIIDQQAHNDETDTALEYGATNAAWPADWGQVTK